MSMRVGVIAASNHPIREPFAGGLERQTWMLARGLAARGHDVTVYAGAGSIADGFAVETIGPTDDLRLTDDARADASMVAEGAVRQHHAYLHLMLRLRERDDLDVVHNNSLHHLPVAMIDALVAPMTMTLHTPPTPWLESALRLAAPRAPRCVAVSEDTARRWAPVVDAQVVPNAVDEVAWPPGPGGSGRAVWTGRLVPEKGPHLALDAAHVAGLDLDLAGPVGDVAYVRDEVVPRLRDGDRMHGHLDATALAALVGRAEVQLVTPCWEEPYGMVVPEALACGTPVAAFARGALPELLDESCGRLAAPDDVGDLARAAKEAATLSRAAGRTRALRTAGLDRMIDRYEALFEEVVA